MRIVRGKNPLPHSISPKTLARWSDEVILLCAGAQLTEDLNLSKCIYLVDHFSNTDVIDAALIPGFRHIVQSAGKNSEEEINIAAAIIENPAHYFSDSLSATMATTESRSFTQSFHVSTQKKEILSEIEYFLTQVHGVQFVRDDLLRIADELFMNAIFDAPNDPVSGFRHRESPRGLEVRLDEREAATISIGFNKDWIVISCADPFGSLAVEKLLIHMQASYHQGVGKTMRQVGGGAGIGCFTIFELSSSFYIGIDAGKKTVVSCKMPLGKNFRSVQASLKNIHIIKGTEE